MIERPPTPDRPAPTFVLTFAAGADLPRRALADWVSSQSIFADSALRHAKVEDLQGIYVPAYLYSAVARSAYRAEIGENYTETEHYTDSEGNSQTRTVTRTRGLTWDECAVLSPYYDMGSAFPILDDGPALPGQVEAFDAQRSAARRTVTAAIEGTAAGRLQQGTIPGSRFRNIKVSVLLERLETRRVVLPVWILAYHYRGSPYRALVHAQRGLVTGASPMSTWKLLLVLGIVAAVIAAILFVATS